MTEGKSRKAERKCFGMSDEAYGKNKKRIFVKGAEEEMRLNFPKTRVVQKTGARASLHLSGIKHKTDTPLTVV